MHYIICLLKRRKTFNSKTSELFVHVWHYHELMGCLTCQRFISVIVEVNLWLPEQSLDFYWLQMHFRKSSQPQLIKRPGIWQFHSLCWQVFFPFSPCPSPLPQLLLHVPLGHIFKKECLLCRLRITLKNMSPRPQWFVYLSLRYNHVTVVSGCPYLTAVVVVSISIELKEKSKVFSKHSMCQKAS